jgi:MFS family permease
MANARRLDALNFFLADVRDGLGPYLAIYLLTIQHWDQASIGLVMSVGGIAGILAQTPAGAIADGTTAKRAVLVSAAAIVTLGSLALPWMSNFAVRGFLYPLWDNPYWLVGVQLLDGFGAGIFGALFQ